MKHGKHVACAVPSTFGSLEEAEELYKVVKETGLNYMLFETSAFHDAAYAMRVLFDAGHFGRMLYTEGEYYHYMDVPIDSYKGWRIGLPPQYYPTHSNGYHTCVTGESFTEVSCMGIPSSIEHLKPENNIYKNPFGTEIALFRTSGGGMSRMAVSWDTPGYHGEMGRVRAKGSMINTAFQGSRTSRHRAASPRFPSRSTRRARRLHGYLMNEFVHSILENRQPLVDIAWG